MNRRRFLAGVGAAVSAGAVSRLASAGDETLEVVVWVSEAAAEYDALRARVEGHLGRALREAVGEARITAAEAPVDTSAESGRRALGVKWPARVAGARVGLTDLGPTGDVNLLVTDGDPTRQPAGYARPYVAAATGAEAIADAPPAAEAGRTVPYSVSTAAVQVLLHECGHALGLSHDAGRAFVEDDAVVASPMVGSYLWKSAETRRRYLDERNACGSALPGPGAAPDRRLELGYGPCARRSLRQSLGLGSADRLTG